MAHITASSGAKASILLLSRRGSVRWPKYRREQPLLVTGAFYADDTMRRLPLLSSDPRVDTLLVLGQSVFRDIGCASFSISILHQSCASRFIDGAYSSYEDGSFALVAVHLFPLERFPEQKVGVVIYKGRKST